MAEQWIRSAWFVRPYCFEIQLNCCEVRNVDDDDNNNCNNNLISIIVLIIIIIIAIIIITHSLSSARYEMPTVSLLSHVVSSPFHLVSTHR